MEEKPETEDGETENQLKQRNSEQRETNGKKDPSFMHTKDDEARGLACICMHVIFEDTRIV